MRTTFIFNKILFTKKKKKAFSHWIVEWLWQKSMSQLIAVKPQNALFLHFSNSN